MKRTIIILAGVALAVVLLLPGLVGGLALRQHERHVGMTTRASANFRVATEAFERGWFRSRARYRIELGDALRQAVRRGTAASDAADELPALIIDSVLHHGPFALGAATVDGGTWRPVLAVAVSRVRLVSNSRTLFELPGQVVTRIRFGGGGTAHYANGPARIEGSGQSLHWSGAAVDVGFDAQGTRIESSGTVGALTAVDADGRLMSGPLEFTTSQSRSKFGFWLGASRVDWARLAYTRRGRPPVGMRALSLRSAMRYAEGSVSADLDLAIGGLGANGWSAGPFVFRSRTTQLEPEALGRLVQTVQSMSTPLDAAGQEALAKDLAGLLAAGPRFAVEELRMRTPEGEVLASAAVEFPQTPDASGADLLVLAFGSQSDLSLRVPAALVAAASAASPESRQYLQLLLDTGLLLIENGHYTVRAVYEGGLLTVNGIPVPIPFSAT